MIFTKRTKFYLIFFHILLGYVALNYAPIFKYYYIVLFLYSLFYVFNKDKRETRISHYFIAYFVTTELLNRLSGTNFIDQFGKYSIMLIILISFLKTGEFNRLKPGTFILFFFLMLASLFLVNSGSFSRDISLVSFYLSGPVCLAFCVFYFNDCRFEFNKDFINSLFISLLPIIAILVYLFLKSGAVDVENLTYSANRVQSGGFGPNQVAVILGYGILVILVGFIFRNSITGSFILDGAILVLLVYRTLLTFSRGGFTSAIAALVLAIIYISFRNRSFITSNKRAMSYLGLGLIIVAIGWVKTNQVTGNKLSERYQGYSSSTVITGEKKYTTGRNQLMEIEIDIFKDNWILGIGPGMATSIRGEKYYGSDEIIANHTEFTRMLAEHGTFGLIALLILIFYPIYKLRRSRNMSNGFMIVLFVSLSLLTQGHNAHRLALPSFLYGFAFVNLVKDKKKRLENDPPNRK